MSRDGERFYMQLAAQPKAELFGESDRKFFLKVVDAQITFDVDAQGAATQLTLHQGGRNTAAKRLTEAEAKSAAAELEARNLETAERIKEQSRCRGARRRCGG